MEDLKKKITLKMSSQHLLKKSRAYRDEGKREQKGKGGRCFDNRSELGYFLVNPF